MACSPHPEVSVIIPVYNTQEYIKNCLESVQGQTLQDMEIICVSDGSTDNTLKILEEYASADPRIKIITQEHAGPGPARNRAMSVAKGKYISFMDGDDQYPEKDTLEKLVRAIKEHGCEVAGGYVQYLKGDQILPPSNRAYKIIKDNPNGCLIRCSELQTCFSFYCYLFDRELLVKENILFPDYLYFEDPVFLTRIMCKAGLVYLIPDATYRYRKWYKPNVFDYRKTKDLIRGHIDVLSLAKENNLKFLYSDVVKSLMDFKQVIVRNISLENLDLYLLVVKFSTITDLTNEISPTLMRVLASVEDRLSVLISAQYAKGHDWLISLLESIRTQYLNMCPEGDNVIDCSLLRVLKGIFTPKTPYLARVMLKDCLTSSKYQSLELQKHEDEWYSASALEAKRVLDSVIPAFRFVEELKNSRGDDCRIVRDTSVDHAKFSVIIPVYNAVPYLKDCLESVVNQTLANIEIICVDDGSTDESLSILMEYAQRYSNIKVLHQSNAGLSVARNQGLKEATGEFIHFLDSDDFVEPNTYETLYGRLVNQNLDMLFFNAKAVYEDEELEKKYPGHKTAFLHERDEKIVQSGRDYYVETVLNNTFTMTVWLYGIRRSFLENNQLRFIEGAIHEDNFFTAECMLLAGRVSHINEQLYYYRLHHGSLTTVDKDFRHVYGYFVNFCKLHELLLKGKFEPKVLDAVAIRIPLLVSAGYGSYLKISDKYQRNYFLALPPSQSVLFRQLFYERFLLDQKLQAIDKRKKILEEKCLASEASIKQLKTQEIRELSNKLNASQARESALKKSVSFRIGRAITWAPRKLRSLGG